MSDLRGVIGAALPKSAQRYVERIAETIEDEEIIPFDTAGYALRVVLDPGRPITSKEDVGDGVTVERWGSRIVSVVLPGGFEALESTS